MCVDARHVIGLYDERDAPYGNAERDLLSCGSSGSVVNLREASPVGILLREDSRKNKERTHTAFEASLTHSITVILEDKVTSAHASADLAIVE